MKTVLLFVALVSISSMLIGQTRVGSTKTKLSQKAEQFNFSLVVDKSYTPEELVTDFFDGSCVQVSNVSYNGNSNQCGFFWADQTSLGVQAGIMLATGDITNAEGPNNSTSTSSGYVATGDNLLDSISGFLTHDAAVLEFDFISDKPDLSFNYVFGSEEYPEYVGSSFNDIFGFFITGPGFSNNQNVALIPNTNTPVSINNINKDLNSGYYISNPIGGNEIEYDGYTVPISSTFSVIPGEIYHAKLAIADVGDYSFDSGVLIGFNSMCGDSPLKPKKVYASVKPSGLGKFSFIAKSKYATAYHWDFGDGESSFEKEQTHTYAQEGDYNVNYIASNFCCSDTTFLQVKVSFGLQVAETTAINPTCSDKCDGNIQLSVIGGKQPYTYQWSNGTNTDNLYNLCEGIYSVTIFDADENLITSTVELISPNPIEIKVYQTYGIDQSIITKVVSKGGTPPYIYNWSDGTTTQVRTDIKYGQGYSVKVTDKFGCISEISKIGDPFAKVMFKAGFNSKIMVRELSISPYNLENTKAELKVFNILGQTMWTGIVSEQDITLDTKNWSGGIYFIRMRSEEGVVQKTIFIK